jgi:integrase
MSQSQRYRYTEPALCHYDYDIEKSWFVHYTFTDTLTKKSIRVQVRKGLNYWHDKESRLKAGHSLRKSTIRQLESGYNPFLDSEKKRDPEHYTIYEAMSEILKIKLTTARSRTKESYTHMVKIFKDWLDLKGLTNIPLSQFSPAMASQYMDYLLVTKQYAGRTHNDRLTDMKTFYNAMIAREWVSKNPFKGILKQQEEIGRNLAYSESEKDALRKYLYLHDRDMYYFSQIMYYCFIRRSELSRLKVWSFDLKNKTITIPADVSKNKCQESVVIPVGLEPILREMELHKYNQNDYLFGYKLKRSTRIFKNINHISTRHNKFPPKLGIDEEKGLYSWKHTGACQAYYDTNKDVYALMRQLRHRDLNTTMIYLKSLGLTQNDVFRNAMVA